MTRKKIAIDMDDTIAYLVKDWVKAINEGENENVEVVSNWDIASHFKCGKKVYNYLSYDLYRNLDVIEDSQETIKMLMQKYDVFIVTSATHYLDSLVSKVEWLKEHFPFIPLSNVVLCGDKSIINADIMIDDGVHNLETFKGIGLLFNADHNREDKKFRRVYNWKEIQEILL